MYSEQTGISNSWLGDKEVCPSYLVTGDHSVTAEVTAFTPSFPLQPPSLHPRFPSQIYKYLICASPPILGKVGTALEYKQK